MNDYSRLKILPQVARDADHQDVYLSSDFYVNNNEIKEIAQWRVEVGVFPVGIVTLNFFKAASKHLIIRNSDSGLILFQYTNTAGSACLSFSFPGETWVIPDFVPAGGLALATLDIDRRIDILAIGI